VKEDIEPMLLNNVKPRKIRKVLEEYAHQDKTKKEDLPAGSRDCH